MNDTATSGQLDGTPAPPSTVAVASVWKLVNFWAVAFWKQEMTFFPSRELYNLFQHMTGLQHEASQAVPLQVLFYPHQQITTFLMP